MAYHCLIYISENIFNLRVKDQLIGSYLYDRFNEPIARIDAILAESKTYLVRYLVINVGGFLNIHGKKILLPIEVCESADLGKVKTDWLLESLKDAPAPNDPENVTMSEEELILGYFDLKPYWAMRGENLKPDQDPDA